MTDEKMVQAYIDFLEYGPDDQLFEIWDRPPTRKRRKRKLSLARSLREAKNAGVAVVGATVEPDKVTLNFGKPNSEERTVIQSADDELAQWRKRKQDAHSG